MRQNTVANSSIAQYKSIKQISKESNRKSVLESRTRTKEMKQILFFFFLRGAGFVDCCQMALYSLSLTEII